MGGHMTNQERLLSDQAETALFKDMLRAVVGSVSILAAGQGADRRGFTITAGVSLCADPPIVLAYINRNVEVHDVILGTGAFSWNVLSVDQLELAERFSMPATGNGASRFSPAQWGEMITGSPVLLASACIFDCKIQGALEQETHTIIVASIVAQIFNKNNIPLLCFDE